jgi:peptide/nickel transport system ATP-binding protein
MNILAILIEPLVIQGIGTRDERIERAKRVLSEVELPASQNFLDQYPHHLSGGEVQRLVIARALMLEPKLLIADEPTSSLDASVQAKIIKLLNNIQENRGLAILFITHNLNLARKVSDRIVKLENGIINPGFKIGNIE